MQFKWDFTDTKDSKTSFQTPTAIIPRRIITL